MKHDHELSPEEFQRVLAERVKQYSLSHPEETHQAAEDTLRLCIESERQLAIARATQEQMQDELAAKEARIAELEAILVTVARNAPVAEPTRLQRDTLPQAWSFWQAGRLAKRVLGITD